MPPILRKSLNKTYNAKDVRKWTEKETRKLIENIRRRLKVHDPLPYRKRIKALNLDEITIPPKSINDRKSRVDDVIKKIRRTRTLGEILTDVSPFQDQDVKTVLPCSSTPKIEVNIDDDYDDLEVFEEAMEINEQLDGISINKNKR